MCQQPLIHWKKSKSLRYSHNLKISLSKDIKRQIGRYELFSGLRCILLDIAVYLSYEVLEFFSHITFVIPNNKTDIPVLYLVRLSIHSCKFLLSAVRMLPIYSNFKHFFPYEDIRKCFIVEDIFLFSFPCKNNTFQNWKCWKGDFFSLLKFKNYKRACCFLPFSVLWNNILKLFKNIDYFWLQLLLILK